MNDKEWLAKLKAGDEVIVSSSGWGAVSRIVAVEKVTATQIVLAGGDRFRRTTGGRVGADAWSRVYLSEATPECRAELARTRKTAVLVNRIRDVNWWKVPLEKLEAIDAILGVNPDAR